MYIYLSMPQIFNLSHALRLQMFTNDGSLEVSQYCIIAFNKRVHFQCFSRSLVTSVKISVVHMVKTETTSKSTMNTAAMDGCHSYLLDKDCGITGNKKIISPFLQTKQRLKQFLSLLRSTEKKDAGTFSIYRTSSLYKKMLKCYLL